MSVDANNARSYTSFEPQTTFYLPPSVLTARVNWDIFLSFKGEDTYQTFVAPLCDALKSKDLRPFMNDEGMERGDTIQPNLDEVMQDSALAVVIISPNYADSHGCLKEISSIYNLYNKNSQKWEKRVIPVFYKVDPSNVRKQRGEFGDGLKKLLDDSSKRFSEEEINKWRSALEAVGNISGYTCPIQSDDHAENIQRIVQQVWSELKNTPEYVAKLDVGLDFRVDKVVDMLGLCQPDVRFLNIHGTPGIGKTTLAKAVYNKLVVKFKNRCFISNVREKLTHDGGILTVQNDIIKGLSSGNLQSSDDGKETIKRIVNQSRVLLVLDDVSEAKQLDDLGIVKKWFDEGSRIIITSRNVDVLPESARSSEHEFYEAEILDASEALELFSIHAFGRRKPTPEFQHISKKIASRTGGLPLALEIIGSSLVKKTKKEWDDALTELECMEWPNSLQQILKISYDGLEDQVKVVFLDISCLFLQLDMKKEDIVDALESCGLRAELAIANLVMKSLLKITERNTLWMHDQIRDMGRKIVIEESSEDAGKRSRLWDSMGTIRILHQGKVTEAVRGIVLNIKKPPDLSDELLCWFDFQRHPSIKSFSRYVIKKSIKLASWHLPNEDDNFVLRTNWFEKMKHMKLLQMDYVKLHGDYQYMPSELRWLRWKGCPEKILPAHIPEELRVLDLSGSKIEQLWIPYRLWWNFNKPQVVGNLVVLDLSYCARLTALPDMSGHKYLKKLNLERCVGLTKIHESIGNLTSLVHLNLRGCINLVEFPRFLTGLQGLKDLILSDCSMFGELPQEIRSMTSLNRLCLDGTAITELPETIFNLIQLEVLNLNSCKQLTWLPDSFGYLTSLKELYVGSTKLKELPCSVGSLTNLQILVLAHCSSLEVLPDTVGMLKALTELRLYDSKIKQLPASICSLSYLRILSLGRCRSLIELPVLLGGLASVIKLVLDNSPIKVLPDEICNLKSMEKLQMDNCNLLERLPKKIGQLSNLSILFVEGAAITKLPKSIGDMENLTWLKLNKCKRLSSLPDSIGNLRSLRILMMEETALTFLPETFGLLDGLRILKMKKSRNDPTKLSLQLPTSFCKLTNLEEFNAGAFGISGKINDQFAELSKLEGLDLGFNNFHSLPSTLIGLLILNKLVLRECKELKNLPGLPATLEELDAADCVALENICDMSNLERLRELRLSNCGKIVDVPGLQCCKSLRRLFMGGCNASASSVKRRLSKDALKNLNTLSLPGREIPGWFTQTAVNFVPHRNLAIKGVIVAVVVSVDITKLDAMRAQLPSIVDIQAKIIRLDEPIFKTTLILTGISCTTDDQLYLCRYKEYHSLILLLKPGDIIQVGWKTEAVDGILLKKWGIYLVFENDDDYEGDENLLLLDESEKSVSQRLAMFFQSMDQT